MNDKEKLLAKMLKLTNPIVQHDYLPWSFGREGYEALFIGYTNYDTGFSTPEHFIITRRKGVFGIYRHVPGGYSSYTYMPEESHIEYPEYDESKLIMLGLTQDERRVMYYSVTGGKSEY